MFAFTIILTSFLFSTKKFNLCHKSPLSVFICSEKYQRGKPKGFSSTSFGYGEEMFIAVLEMEN